MAAAVALERLTRTVLRGPRSERRSGSAPQDAGAGGAGGGDGGGGDEVSATAAVTAAAATATTTTKAGRADDEDDDDSGDGSDGSDGGSGADSFLRRLGRVTPRQAALAFCVTPAGGVFFSMASFICRSYCC